MKIEMTNIECVWMKLLFFFRQKLRAFLDSARVPCIPYLGISQLFYISFSSFCFPLKYVRQSIISPFPFKDYLYLFNVIFVGLMHWLLEFIEHEGPLLSTVITFLLLLPQIAELMFYSCINLLYGRFASI